MIDHGNITPKRVLFDDGETSDEILDAIADHWAIVCWEAWERVRDSGTDEDIRACAEAWANRAYARAARLALRSGKARPQ